MFKTSVRNALLIIATLLLAPLTFSEPLWLDVRTVLEHKIDHIEGDKRISPSDVLPELEQLALAKDTDIRLYCRSGGRAGNVATMLKNAGYTNVHNEGGIDDARRKRGIE